MKRKGQTTFNNENVHRIKMLVPLYSPWLLDIFHQRGKVIDSSPASKSSAPSETKCLTSPSLSRPQKLSRTTCPETHRPRIIMRPGDQASTIRCLLNNQFIFQQCVCRDIELLGSLKSTQEARVALGCASSDPFASFVLSKLHACSISRHTHAAA